MFSAPRIRHLLPVLALAAAALTQACSDAATPKTTSPIETSSTAAFDGVASGVIPTSECAAPGSGWIFCDDFESNRLSKYFEIDYAGGRFARTSGSGRNGSYGMRAAFAAGQASGGRLSLAFGKVPSTYFRTVDAGKANYRELYWRFFVRRESGWVGNGPGALTKAMIFAGSNWSQAMVAYGRTDVSDARYLQLEALSGTDANGKLATTSFNDAAHLRSLGTVRSAAAEEDASHIGQWACYEFHAKLNSVGQANGLFELSVNGQLSARKTGMNWTGAYATYGINSLNIENFYPNVAPAANVRTIDNLVVSTSPIGCGGSVTPPPTPTVATVSVAIDSSSLTTPHQAQATATLRDSTGTPLAGTVTWSSSNASVATVSSAGVVTAVGAGSANIIATSSGKSGQAAISVVAAQVPVASVSVSLAASSVAVGGTTTATATLRDMSGNVLTNRPVTWTSSNAAIATVSSAGVVTAVAAGSANIVATSGGVSGQASFVVTSPPPPPTSGGTLLFSEDFENTSMSSRGWYDIYATPLLSTDHAVATSTRSLQINYAQGALNPGISGRHLFTPSNSVYLSYWVKYSTNWVGSGLSYHPHEFHFITTDDNQYVGPAATHLTMYVEANFQNGIGVASIGHQDASNVDATRIGQDLTSITENRAIAGCNGNPDGLPDNCYQSGGTWYNGKTYRSSTLFNNTPGTAGYKNNWHHVEVYFQLNSIANGKGQFDGIAQYWFDGQLIMDKRNLIYRTAAHPNMKFNQFMFAPFIGNGSPVAQSMWIDDIVVRTAR